MRSGVIDLGWSKLGLQRKRWARENHRCAYCGEPLKGRQKVFCDDTACSWYFTTDIRYHLGYYHWSIYRRYALKRDSYRCVKCGAGPGVPDDYDNYPDLNVHHIIPISEGGKEFDTSNLITLCKECHKAQHAAKDKIWFKNPINMTLEQFAVTSS